MLTSLGVDYLYDKTLMGMAYTQSDEDDYHAQSVNFSVSHDFFGDMTTISLGYGYGDDTVKRNSDDQFEEAATHQPYRFELSQVITKHLIMNAGYEAVVDEGFLNNPHRSVRYVDSTVASGYSYQSEIYPETRSSDAFALRMMMYLPYRAVIRGEYRYYTDSWNIQSHDGEVSYTHPLGNRWEFDFKLRYYAQTSADFFSDLSPFQNAQNFLARDKELATFNNATLGGSVKYVFNQSGFMFFNNGAFDLSVDHIMFQYDDFSDVTANESIGSEPTYEFNAWVIRSSLTLWF